MLDASAQQLTQRDYNFKEILLLFSGTRATGKPESSGRGWNCGLGVRLLDLEPSTTGQQPREVGGCQLGPRSDADNNNQTESKSK